MPGAQDFTGLLEWRCIGPFRGGRVVAVSGDYDNPNVFYFGGVAGGIWKTSDGGQYWECVSDPTLKTSSVGALEVAPSDSNVIYAGMGETTIRIDVSHGDGVYKSTDAGKSWQHMGLADTRHIGKIRVHPQNPGVVWVAALGHAFGPHPARGVYKSTDGGQTWRLVLHKSDKAGAVDLSVDPKNPRILFTTIWEAFRSPWMISSGGPDSSLWRSTDGGETWVDISGHTGLPQGIKGKMAVAVSPARQGRVWALIEHQPDGGLYRSDNYGDTWEKVNGDFRLISRAWYYVHLTADPQDGDTVYINNLAFWKSTDGGKTFAEIDTPHGDNHDLWIDPRNPLRMIQGNDGGANVSYNGAASWSSIYNQPTAQFYHLATDDHDPYYVYGTQQDNTSIAVPSDVNHNGIKWGDCFETGSGESGYIVVHPDDNNIIYVGAIGSAPGGGNSLERYDRRIDQLRLITTWPETMNGYGAEEDKYRFHWTYPIILSPHDPNTLYIGGNLVFRSTNEGQSWEPISPDLTRADPETLKPTGGPVNRDSIGAETYAIIFSLVESPHERGTLWAGSDDGLIHLTRDGGQTWVNVTPSGMLDWSTISGIEVSPYDPGTVYVAAYRYKLDDYRPYIYKTTDYGKSWTRIDDGIPSDDFVRVVRADPVRRGLLFAGTETGLYLSWDDGGSWQRFMLNLPVSPVHEILIKHDDLIVGTHGRSIWILDDISPLRQMNDDVTQSQAHLFTPRATKRILPGIDWVGNNVGSKNYLGNGGAFTVAKTPEGALKRTYLDVGTNPPRGAIVTYWLAATPAQPIKLTIQDASGMTLREFTSLTTEERKKAGQAHTLTEAEASQGTLAGEGEEGEELKPNQDAEVKDLRAPAAAGWNRFVWDLRLAHATKIEGTDAAAESLIEGPFVAPGTYSMTLTVGGQSQTQRFAVVTREGVTASAEDLQAQYNLQRRIHDKVSQTAAAINQMRDLRGQLDGWSKRAAGLPTGKAVGKAAGELRDRVLEVEKKLLVPDIKASWVYNNEGLRLYQQLAELRNVVGMGDYPPTDQAYAVLDHLTAKIDPVLAEWETLKADAVAGLNRQIAEAGLGAVTVKG